MPNGLPDPFSALRQMGEQANVALKQVGDTVSTGASQLLNTLAAPLRGAGGPGGLRLPGLPGLTGGNPGNPNMGGLLAPLTAPLQVVSQLEEVAIPRGMPRPAAQLLRTIKGVTPAPTPTPTPETPAPAAARPVTGVARMPQRPGI